MSCMAVLMGVGKDSGGGGGGDGDGGGSPVNSSPKYLPGILRSIRTHTQETGNQLSM